METVNKIDRNNIQIVKTIETKRNYNLDSLNQRKLELENELNEVNELIKKFF